MPYYIDLFETEERVFDTLPHGSGIDDTWQVKATNKYYVCNCAYHVMDDNGFYVGWAPFTLRIPLEDDPLKFKLSFSGRDGSYLARKYDLREYLEDLFAEWVLENMSKLVQLQQFRKGRAYNE